MTDKEISDLQECCFATPGKNCPCKQVEACDKYMDIIGWSPAWSKRKPLTEKQIEQLKGA